MPSSSSLTVQKPILEISFQITLTWKTNENNMLASPVAFMLHSSCEWLVLKQKKADMLQTCLFKTKNLK